MVIYVNDANDPPTMDDASVSVSEATSAGTSILTLTGDDPEGKALKFRLSKDDPSGVKAFTIDTNGVVRVATSPTGGTYLDYEDRVRWTLQAEVEDDGGLKAVAEVVITVTDANDAPTMTGPIALFVTEDKTSGNFGGTSQFCVRTRPPEAVCLCWFSHSGRVRVCGLQTCSPVGTKTLASHHLSPFSSTVVPVAFLSRWLPVASSVSLARWTTRPRPSEFGCCCLA